ncbi:hypothetical protein ARMGADRAFT_1084066 [Armillaria gallica]|uniref:Uncharacterized protein n=1 Tax=Armillaria gallica TaxID=47427 RepID=A0A2H3D0Y8_ARMGA|nr:hypothetical protein ARMGADRAFT_1084066 [Armillaria gallica]
MARSCKLNTGRSNPAPAKTRAQTASKKGGRGPKVMSTRKDQEQGEGENPTLQQPANTDVFANQSEIEEETILADMLLIDETMDGTTNDPAQEAMELDNGEPMKTTNQPVSQTGEVIMDCLMEPLTKKARNDQQVFMTDEYAFINDNHELDEYYKKEELRQTSQHLSENGDDHVMSDDDEPPGSVRSEFTDFTC